MIGVLRQLLFAWEAKWAERSSKVMKRSQRWNTLQICPCRDSNSRGSELWSNTLPVRPRRRPGSSKWKDTSLTLNLTKRLEITTVMKRWQNGMNLVILEEDPVVELVVNCVVNMLLMGTNSTVVCVCGQSYGSVKRLQSHHIIFSRWG